MAIKRLLTTVCHLVLCRLHKNRKKVTVGVSQVSSCSHVSESCVQALPLAPRVPVEICELIIDIVAASVGGGWLTRIGDPWWRTLVACALTCRVWYARAQTHRLKIVELRGRENVSMLYNLLRDDPRLKATV